jgi:2-keto-4-pentenoate hydratase/2-oxohepta-3-ene-1,7-dioic acid hydratase in catechol pathway
MRIARFSHNGEVNYGRVLGADAIQGDAAATAAVAAGSANGNGAGAVSESAGDDMDKLIIAQLDGHPISQGEVKLTGTYHRVAEVRLLPPIVPTKVICIGKNYADHVEEMGGEKPAEPIIFLKPSTAVCGAYDPIQRPMGISERVDYEGELAVVIGRLGRDVPADRASEVIFGYTIANDVTARDLQARDGQWTRAKGFDTFCPLGPWIETDLDPADLELTTRLNDEVKQHSRTSLLMHHVPALIAFVSQVMTLIPGDVLLTGTPAGIGPMAKGDEVSVTIEGIGTLSNPVTDRS